MRKALEEEKTNSLAANSMLVRVCMVNTNQTQHREENAGSKRNHLQTKDGAFIHTAVDNHYSADGTDLEAAGSA